MTEKLKIFKEEIKYSLPLIFNPFQNSLNNLPPKNIDKLEKNLIITGDKAFKIIETLKSEFPQFKEKLENDVIFKFDNGIFIKVFPKIPKIEIF